MWVGGGGELGDGCYKMISDLGVESAMSDFKPESFFLTLFKGQTFLTLERSFFLPDLKTK